jgi:hypothetical protein
VADTCPLCRQPLEPEQEWCLRCGAAARTRLAPAPNWKAPLTALAVLITLALGVLAASVVELAGGFGDSTANPVTVTVTTGAAEGPSATSPAGPTGTPGASTPGASTPGSKLPRGVTP